MQDPLTAQQGSKHVRNAGGKAAPFQYCGAVRYKEHRGSAPMSVVFEVGV